MKITLEPIEYAALTWLKATKPTINKFNEFEYPDYCGLPKWIADQLSGHFVDTVNQVLPTLKRARTLEQMVKAIEDRAY